MITAFPPDYIERVYAGVLGKIIGVYLGRPFEGWSYERIMAELGEITYYVSQQRNLPLVITDDDISGTFTFLRALEDYGYRRDLTPAQIGQSWLNYIIEGRTILWWGGLGNSTEHTAYLRLKQGIAAPESGSIVRNTKVVAEQIGAQIFIDGWAMVAPGDPEFAADLARRAASVSHDGEAIYGAQALAAMEALAFVEPTIDKLLDCAVSLIPHDSAISRMINDIREWHAEFNDWHHAHDQIVATYGYDRYGGNCHVVPNHALIVLGLLYGAGNFQRSLQIANTSGWDTDCNSGNLGCLLGIRNGLAAFEGGPDWRGPVADRLYLPTADGGRAISDAVIETYQIVNAARALAGKTLLAPKDGARFHFELPGAVQGFRPSGGLALEHVAGHSQRGEHSLALRYQAGVPSSTATPTFILPDEVNMQGYGLLASPTLYAGQTVRAGLSADETNAAPLTARLFLRRYGTNDELARSDGPAMQLVPGAAEELTWSIPDLEGAPIAEVGVEVASEVGGSAYLDFLGWAGTPKVTLTRPRGGGALWRRAWVDAADQWESWHEPFRIMQNHGTGLVIQGTREWSDYTVTADVTPHMAAAAGLAARVQGLRRYYALLLVKGGKAQLVKELDGEQVLGEQELGWAWGQTYELRLSVEGTCLRAWVDGALLFELNDENRPLRNGAVALVCTEGRMATQCVTVG